jgi:L-aminopeptidase/D-esterase-like protein
VCAAVAPVVERAIARAILAATAVAGVPAYRDVFPSSGA